MRAPDPLPASYYFGPSQTGVEIIVRVARGLDRAGRRAGCGGRARGRLRGECAGCDRTGPGRCWKPGHPIRVRPGRSATGLMC